MIPKRPSMSSATVNVGVGVPEDAQHWHRRFHSEDVLLLTNHWFVNSMTQSLCVVIHGRCCKFSMDPEGGASFEYLSATWYLPDNLSASRQYREN